MHVKVVAGRAKDPYAQPSPMNSDIRCGCKVAECGWVIPEDDCKAHGKNRTLQRTLYTHSLRECPGPKKETNQLKLFNWDGSPIKEKH